MSESQELSRLNLDALTVPEALVNTIRIMEMFSTRLNRLNPPRRQIRPKKNLLRIYPQEPYNRFRNAPRSAGGATTASAIALRLLKS